MSFRPIAVVHRLGSMELKAFLVDQNRRVATVVLRWADKDDTKVPPEGWIDTAKAEAENEPPPMDAMFRGFRGR
jgi:hypothetical protein